MHGLANDLKRIICIVTHLLIVLRDVNITKLKKFKLQLATSEVSMVFLRLAFTINGACSDEPK